MDLTQIGIGLGLLVISGLTFVGPSALDRHVVSLLMVAGLLAGVCVALATVARDACRSTES